MDQQEADRVLFLFLLLAVDMVLLIQILGETEDLVAAVAAIPMVDLAFHYRVIMEELDLPMRLLMGQEAVEVVLDTKAKMPPKHMAAMAGMGSKIPLTELLLTLLVEEVGVEILVYQPQQELADKAVEAMEAMEVGQRTMDCQILEVEAELLLDQLIIQPQAMVGLALLWFQFLQQITQA